MHEYKVEINDIETKMISSISELTQEFTALQVADDGHISFEPNPMFGDLNEFGILKTSREKGLFKKRRVQEYYLELNFDYPDGKSGLCGYVTSDFNEIREMLFDLINHQKFPDISSWIMTKFDANGNTLSFEESNPHLCRK